MLLRTLLHLWPPGFVIQKFHTTNVIASNPVNICSLHHGDSFVFVIFLSSSINMNIPKSENQLYGFACYVRQTCHLQVNIIYRILVHTCSYIACLIGYAVAKGDNCMWW